MGQSKWLTKEFEIYTSHGHENTSVCAYQEISDLLSAWFVLIVVSVAHLVTHNADFQSLADSSWCCSLESDSCVFAVRHCLSSDKWVTFSNFLPAAIEKVKKKDAFFSSDQEPQHHKLYTLDSTFLELNLLRHNTLNKWVILFFVIFFCSVPSATESFKIALRYVHLLSSSTCLVSLMSPLKSHAAQTGARVQEYSSFIPTMSEQNHHCT